LALLAEAEEFKGVVVDLEFVGLLEFLFEMVDGALVDREGVATLQTGEVVPIGLDGGVEGFAGGNGADLDESFFFEAVKGAVDGGKSHRLGVVAQFDVEVLGGNRSIESLQ
jgi:hypothetical protein